MKKILILGTGRSSSSLINYLLQNADSIPAKITVADASIDLARQKISNHPAGKAIAFDVNDAGQRSALVSAHDLVISLMPPPFHFQVAQSCLEFSKHLLTASYISPEIASLDAEAKAKNVLILMETGLDPGIDHMSAMAEIIKIKEAGGKLISFKSFTGGLIAPESDDNPWHYKITWNPRNVVLAGKGISTYLLNGNIVEVDYKDLFRKTEKITVKGFGEFEGYPNRDSLKYLETYRLNGLKTFLRGTLRKPNYCKAWNVLVNTGYTSEERIISSSDLTYKNLTDQLLKDFPGKTTEDKFKNIADGGDIEMLTWLGIFSDHAIHLSNASPADALQKLMEEKWKLNAEDKDMIVMQHQFEYEAGGKVRGLNSSLVVKGENQSETAMAKTVGLPLGIAAKMLLQGTIGLRGVQIPVERSLYEPILKELEELGIQFFNEEATVIN